MYIIEGYNYSLDEYVGHIEKIGNNNPQERNYQELISYFLKRIFINTDIEVIDVSTNRNTKLHNRDNYTGNGGTPDLLLARGYQYANIDIEEQSIEYIAAIEIKAFKKQLNESELIKKHKKQLESHLSINKKVIFTDCVTWCFFHNGNLEPERSFNLKGNPIEWKAEKRKVDEAVKEPLNIESDYLGTKHKEWNELQNYIREFVYKK
ncbi:hypothetical protein J2T12_004314 [Paenibacillus anaericanus]|uniref:hypothetical protein n=1 Tax=Paenibacillus anaericanus TaxID=170367 RepID=UPI00277EA7EB|nr:hypothetical protein [Paenibacillus anaericanus]MDQ0090888.1 hypothetical protein [Paenibacillus anaericanus]